MRIVLWRDRCSFLQRWDRSGLVRVPKGLDPAGFSNTTRLDNPARLHRSSAGLHSTGSTTTAGL
ncbi:MAG TPA: hypothetical protein VHK68_08415, partial [Gemmatimonadales bacterium]|nr:hypothetical protein [Gemmatimonadales bacterium]